MKSFFIAHPAKGTGSVTKRLLSSPASKAYGNASCYGIDASCAHRLHLLEDSATSLLLVSCTEWCAGHGCPATFLLRFLAARQSLGGPGTESGPQRAGNPPGLDTRAPAADRAPPGWGLWHDRGRQLAAQLGVPRRHEDQPQRAGPEIAPGHRALAAHFEPRA